MRSLYFVFVIMVICSTSVFAQTTTFSYQGKLTDGGLPATGQYDLRFRLYTAVSGGTQVGADVTADNVQVTDGVFNVILDFGASPFTTGSGNALEISVRPGASTGAYTTLSPRNQLVSSPYAVQTLRAASAAVADNANQLGGVNAGQFVQTSDARLSDARSPSPGSIDYVQNRSTTQPATNFDISGTGRANVFDAATDFNIAGNRVFSNGGGTNLFAGNFTGTANTTGSYNTFVGNAAGNLNTTGSFNAFLGRSAGSKNTIGGGNIFAGLEAGFNNTTGGENVFVGTFAGWNNVSGNFNTMIGRGTNVAAGDLVNATAVGAGTVVSASNTIALGRSDGSDRVSIPGNLTIGGTLVANAVLGTTVNRQQIAQLRWYDVNRAATITVPGPGPITFAFDGESVWFSPGRKVKVSDGSYLATLPGSGTSVGIAFDGAYLWTTPGVVPCAANQIVKTRAADGTGMGCFTVGTNPRGVAFDGANVWVANSGSNNVTKLRASDGACVGTCNFTVGSFPVSVASDGSNVWVANSLSSNVTKLRASDGANLGSFAVGLTPVGLAFDGANVWVTNQDGDSVTKLRASDGANLGTFPVGDSPQGIAFDGANIWVANFNGNSVTRLRASDGACVGTCTFTVNSAPQGIAFDGANIWVSHIGGPSKL